MKHAPNYQPYPDQCEGWLRLIKHSPGKLADATCIVTDGKSIYAATCVRNEPGCSYMKTLDGKEFRITESSQVQAYFAYFENKTDSKREGSSFKNRFFILSYGLEMFLNKDLRAYIIYDITNNEMELYPTPDERTTIVYGGVARGMKSLQVVMTDKGFRE